MATKRTKQEARHTDIHESSGGDNVVLALKIRESYIQYHYDEPFYCDLYGMILYDADEQ
jgi:hypothetical protein